MQWEREVANPILSTLWLEELQSIVAKGSNTSQTDSEPTQITSYSNTNTFAKTDLTGWGGVHVHTPAIRRYTRLETAWKPPGILSDRRGKAKMRNSISAPWPIKYGLSLRVVVHSFNWLLRTVGIPSAGPILG